MTSFERPILVMCMGRSGSSMTAGVFAAHGVWTGHCHGPDARNKKGYFENIAMKKAMSAAFEDHRTDPRVLQPIPGWKDFAAKTLTQEGWSGGPWLVKHSALFFRSWDDFDPIWILPRRDPDQVFRSTRKCRFWRWLDDEGLRNCIALHNNILDHIRDYRQGVEVIFEDVISGDYSLLEAALRHAGIEPDAEKIAEFVAPGLRTVK